MSKKHTKRRTRAPDELSGADFDRVALWCHEKFPWFERDVPELIEAALEKHGATGTLMADWAKCCMSWIRKHDQFHPEVGRQWRRSRKSDQENTELREAVEESKQPRQLEFGVKLEIRRPKGTLGGMIHDALTEARRVGSLHGRT